MTAGRKQIIKLQSLRFFPGRYKEENHFIATIIFPAFQSRKPRHCNLNIFAWTQSDVSLFGFTSLLMCELNSFYCNIFSISSINLLNCFFWSPLCSFTTSTHPHTCTHTHTHKLHIRFVCFILWPTFAFLFQMLSECVKFEFVLILIILIEFSNFSNQKFNFVNPFSVLSRFF